MSEMLKGIAASDGVAVAKAYRWFNLTCLSTKLP